MHLSRGYNSLLLNNAIWRHDLCELSISLWEFIWGFYYYALLILWFDEVPCMFGWLVHVSTHPRFLAREFRSLWTIRYYHKVLTLTINAHKLLKLSWVFQQ